MSRLTFVTALWRVPTHPPLDAFSQQQAISDPERIQQFQIYRAYIQHEDDLINQRSVWNVTIQGFLFAAFALVVQARTGANGLTLQQAWLVEYTGSFLIPLTGFLVALVSFLSTRAAKLAIEWLQKEYETMVFGISSDEHWEACESTRLTRLPLLPKITGGGHPTAAKHGFALPHMIPIAFMFVWLLTAGVLLFVKVYVPQTPITSGVSAPVASPAPPTTDERR